MALLHVDDSSSLREKIGESEQVMGRERRATNDVTHVRFEYTVVRKYNTFWIVKEDGPVFEVEG